VRIDYCVAGFGIVAEAGHTCLADPFAAISDAVERAVRAHV
jgi:hypothetical protein